jgi:hypothetical protein
VRLEDVGADQRATGPVGGDLLPPEPVEDPVERRAADDPESIHDTAAALSGERLRHPQCA